MKLFIKKLLLASLGLYALLWCLQLVVDFGLRRTDVALYENWNDILNGTINAELLIMGSSRALRHFDPLLIEKKTGFSAYNLGGIKLTFDIQKIKYNAYLQNNKNPKIAVINVDVNSLNSTKELFAKTQYLPYYTLDNYSTLKEFDKNIFHEYVLPMYKYRGFYGAIKDGLLSAVFIIKPHDIHYPKGYQPKDLNWDPNAISRLKKVARKGFEFDIISLKNGFDILKNRVFEMKTTGIEVFLIWSPEHIARQAYEEPNLSMVRKWYEDFANKNDGVYFIDFTGDPLCANTEYLYDTFHLNKKGATLFTKRVSDSILKYSEKF